MAAMVRELDASGALGDFAPALVQTGDRCVARRGADGAVELHLWQRQPVPDELRARLPLRRVLSMCATPRYADVPVPDWCFDAWPAAGVAAGGFDDACAALAAAGAAAPADLRLGWHGTAHHHPSRLRLLELAAAHPDRLACFDVVGAEAAGGGAAEAAHRTLLEQVASYAYLLDVQGKGYCRGSSCSSTPAARSSSRGGREEYHMAGLVPWTHYVPVAENLGDLVERVRADAHPAEVAAIAAAAQQFAREHHARRGDARARARARERHAAARWWWWWWGGGGGSGGGGGTAPTAPCRAAAAATTTTARRRASQDRHGQQSYYYWHANRTGAVAGNAAGRRRRAAADATTPRDHRRRRRDDRARREADRDVPARRRRRRRQGADCARGRPRRRLRRRGHAVVRHQRGDVDFEWRALAEAHRARAAPPTPRASFGCGSTSSPTRSCPSSGMAGDEGAALVVSLRKADRYRSWGKLRMR